MAERWPLVPSVTSIFRSDTEDFAGRGQEAWTDKLVQEAAP